MESTSSCCGWKAVSFRFAPDAVELFLFTQLPSYSAVVVRAVSILKLSEPTDNPLSLSHRMAHTEAHAIELGFGFVFLTMKYIGEMG